MSRNRTGRSGCIRECCRSRIMRLGRGIRSIDNRRRVGQVVRGVDSGSLLAERGLKGNGAGVGRKDMLDKQVLEECSQDNQGLYRDKLDKQDIVDMKARLATHILEEQVEKEFEEMVRESVKELAMELAKEQAFYESLV